MASSDSTPVTIPATLAPKKENITPVCSRIAELTDLKTTLNVEVEQLRTEFQGLRNTLHQQHEDVTASLRNLGLEEGAKEAEEPKVEEKDLEVEEPKEVEN
ncbi:hypothetical protein V6N11_029376 [Hibiscus sabdariffa]|uniref:Uncharacterized protein n=2 Tax=Hibiscus sabdariffa TaxID=183260 RepID=A0ABR2P730_9ROSI